MPPRPLALLASIAALVLVPVPAAHAGAPEPSREVLYDDGPTGRFLLGGRWLFRADSGDRGLRSGWQRSTSTSGWQPVEVPSAWNVGDHSVASMQGSVGWYRKDFAVPDRSRAVRWIARFESVNYRARVWLNGRPVGRSAVAHVPFELDLAGVRRTGTNRLVVRVDSRRTSADFPPAGTGTATGMPVGGWWNYGGILREVYLRRVEGVDLEDVHVDPRLACASCDADVRVRAVVRNVSTVARRVAVQGRFGRRSLHLGTVTVPAGRRRTVATRVEIPDPALWSPARPYLYRVSVDAQSGGRRLAGWRLRSGVRSIRVGGDGVLRLNGERVNFRGVGFHEDTRERGSAITNADRERLVAEGRAVGATLMRTHYPPHPYLHELADRAGMLLWSEIPVYQAKSSLLARQPFRTRAVRLLRRNIAAHRNHPSVVVWSIGNELSSTVGPGQAAYIRQARAAARRLDPTRPVAIAVAGYLQTPCQRAYAPLDVVGINEYFGWYPGPGGGMFDRTRLSGFLDGVRRCYPDKALVVSEFGAEANRDGPVEEKGTWLFQRDFVDYHLSVFATKPWLSGAAYWALNEFRVRPGWEGGNPRPSPPIHQKGILTYDGVRKPAWADLHRHFTAIRQYGG